MDNEGKNIDIGGFYGHNMVIVVTLFMAGGGGA